MPIAPQRNHQADKTFGEPKPPHGKRLWTSQELDAEYAYRLAERLGMIAGTDTPTDEQYELAATEATEAVMELMEQGQ